MKKLILTALLALALPAYAQLTSLIPLPSAGDSTVQADPNYAAALAASLAIVQEQTTAMRAASDAKAACYSALASVATSASGSETSRVAAAVALGISCASYGSGPAAAGSGPMTAQIPAPPVQVQSGNWMQALVNAPGALIDGIAKIAPAWVQYALGVVNAKSNTAIQIAQSQERSGLYQTFGNINQTTVNGMSAVATQGFITIGAIPHTNTYNLTNSNGVGFGTGNLTYNPITSSYNPVRTCSGGAAAPGGAGGAGSATSPGGNGANGGSSTGGTC